MKITLDIEHALFLEEIEKVLVRFRMYYDTDLTEKQTITEQKRQARMKFFQNYKPIGNKGNYMPTKGECYEL